MKSADLERVEALLQESWSPELRPYLTSAQHGVMAFLDVHLTHPESFSEKRYYVATDADDQAIGFAEFRLSAARVGFLSYICVSEHARGLGVATSLIEHFVKSHDPLERIEVDVFHDNVPALRFYEKLDFTQRSQSAWLRRDLPQPSTALSLSNPPESAAAHAAYGFCELKFQWEGQDIRLGRIGETVLRCFDRRSFADDELLASAKATFATLTEALTILPVSEATSLPPGTSTVGLSNRLVKAFDTKAGPAQLSAHSPALN
jgi:ribosomal protein S18 acetylase RimI-like enzyme